jgi:hypothetical protein
MVVILSASNPGKAVDYLTSIVQVRQEILNPENEFSSF